MWLQARHKTEELVRAFARSLPGDVLCYVDTEASVFALTFDDGPHRDTTPALLDVLARHGAKATFFVLGEQIPANAALVARIVAEGHELANHLMRDEPSIRLSADQFGDQLAEVNALLAGYGQVRWFRPGSGWFTPRMLKTGAGLGLRCVLGTVVACNGGGTRDEGIAQRLVRRIKPGSIAVLHEGRPERHGVAETTNVILTELGRRKLSSVTLSTLDDLSRRPMR